MTGPRCLLALDQGTTSSRAALFAPNGRLLALRSREFPQLYPQPGWVEHDPLAIWESQLAVAQQVIREAGVAPADIAAIGIANQRETTLVWEAATGRPVGNAIVWQCRRTAAACDALRARGWAERVQAKTGLVIDAYFSATKLAWILDHTPGLRRRAARGEVLFGNVDSWLLWRLSGGKVHVTDYSNASRTMLYQIHTLDWDDDLLGELGIPRAMLPRVTASSEVYGTAHPDLLGAAIPLAGDAGDQQAALFGQACFSPGAAKSTYGTGCFLLMNTGQVPVSSRHGLLTTIAWGLGGQVEYALEGSIFIAGAAVQWLRDELRIISSAAQSARLAASIPDNGGVYLVPAFVGLGAPYWDMYARGAVLGLTRGTGRAHLVRAALEAICYQVRDVLEAMGGEAGVSLPALRVDGGAAANNFLLQFQSDLLGVPVERPRITETTALGAAYLAGLAVGCWQDRSEIARRWRLGRRFRPQMAPAAREALYAGWQRAVTRAAGWLQP